MVLLFQALALLAAGGAVAALVAGGVTRRAFAKGVVVAVAAVAAALLGNGLWSTARGFVKDRDQASRLTPQQAADAGGAALGLNLSFIGWAYERLRPGDSFYMMPAGSGIDPATYQWVSYKLLPHLHTATPEKADVLVFYNDDPSKDAKYDRRRFGPPTQFAKGFAIARRRDEG